MNRPGATRAAKAEALMEKLCSQLRSARSSAVKGPGIHRSGMGCPSHSRNIGEARRLIELYRSRPAWPRERVLIKVASTWEGHQVAAGKAGVREASHLAILTVLF